MLAFADLSDSDDSEAEPVQEASVGYSRAAAAPVAPAHVAPPPAALRPIRVAPKPEALPQPRNFTPLVRGGRGDDGESPERVSPTSVLPPPRAASGSVYTYFDKNSGMLVTATVPMPTPAPVRVMPQLADSEEDDWDAPDRDFIAGAQAPPPPPLVVAATLVPPPLPAEYPAPGAARGRKPAKAARGRRGGVHPLLGLLAAAAGVGIAICGKAHVAAGAAAVRSFAVSSVEATRRLRAAAAAAERAAEDEPAMLRVPAAAAKPLKAAAPAAAEAAAPVTEWQLRPAARPTSAPPPSEDAWRAGPPGSVREVRWQPHVSLGRG